MAKVFSFCDFVILFRKEILSKHICAYISLVIISVIQLILVAKCAGIARILAFQLLLRKRRENRIVNGLGLANPYFILSFIHILLTPALSLPHFKDKEINAIKLLLTSSPFSFSFSRFLLLTLFLYCQIDSTYIQF